MRLLNVQCALLRSKRVMPRQFWTGATGTLGATGPGMRSKERSAVVAARPLADFATGPALSALRHRRSRCHPTMARTAR